MASKTTKKQQQVVSRVRVIPPNREQVIPGETSPRKERAIPVMAKPPKERIKPLPKEPRPRMVPTVAIRQQLILNQVAPWEIASVTYINLLFVAIAATSMFLIAIAAASISFLEMETYVVLAIMQGTWGWGGYFLARLSHWEHPFPATFKPVRWVTTIIWVMIGGVTVLFVQVFTNQFVQLTANSFLVGAYVVLAAICESQFFHIALTDGGGSLGALICRWISSSLTRTGEVIGKIAVIVPANLFFVSLHSEYMGNMSALVTVFCLGVVFSSMYAISKNAESVFIVHVVWNFLLLIKFGGATV